jgi:3D (Asp-Asp-Asp) domain-containing protein
VRAIVLGLLVVLLPPAFPQVHAAGSKTYTLKRVSHYNAVRAQTDSTPHISACGPTRKGQIALSRDLLRKVGCGARVRVTVRGKSHVYVVNDTMNARYNRTADILVSGVSRARALGVTSGKLTVLRAGRPYRG